MIYELSERTMKDTRNEVSLKNKLLNGYNDMLFLRSYHPRFES